jgi:hypothetical protein
MTGILSPCLRKGGSMGIIRGYKIPPNPPFPKGGVLKEFLDENWL